MLIRSKVPGSLLAKLSLHTSKYGLLHALAAHMGRRCPLFWRLAGPLVTAGYRKSYLRRAAPLILNLGGGNNGLQDCLTADIDPHADVYADMQRPLPFPDRCFDAVFLEEAIEHIPHCALQDALSECLRVLKPGRIIRIVTPDLEYFASRVAADLTGGGEINAFFYNHGHRRIYSKRAMQQQCQRAGFVNVRFTACQDPNSRLAYLDTHAERYGCNPQISLYLEVERPR